MLVLPLRTCPPWLPPWFFTQITHQSPLLANLPPLQLHTNSSSFPNLVCHHTTVTQLCPYVTTCMFFWWSLCRNRLSSFKIASFQVCYYSQHRFCGKLSYIYYCELKSFDKFPCRSVTRSWSLLIYASTTSQFRLISPSICRSSAYDGSSPMVAENYTSNSVCNLLYCTYLSGDVVSYLWAHCILWCWQVWGVAWCYAWWIQALRSNNIWFLVLFHPSINVLGSRWVYMIKNLVDGSVRAIFNLK